MSTKEKCGRVTVVVEVQQTLHSREYCSSSKYVFGVNPSNLVSCPNTKPSKYRDLTRYEDQAAVQWNTLIVISPSLGTPSNKSGQVMTR